MPVKGGKKPREETVFSKGGAMGGREGDLRLWDELRGGGWSFRARIVRWRGRALSFLFKKIVRSEI